MSMASTSALRGSGRGGTDLIDENADEEEEEDTDTDIGIEEEERERDNDCCWLWRHACVHAPPVPSVKDGGGVVDDDEDA